MTDLRDRVKDKSFFNFSYYVMEQRQDEIPRTIKSYLRSWWFESAKIDEMLQ